MPVSENIIGNPFSVDFISVGIEIVCILVELWVASDGPLHGSVQEITSRQLPTKGSQPSYMLAISTVTPSNQDAAYHCILWERVPIKLVVHAIPVRKG